MVEQADEDDKPQAEQAAMLLSTRRQLNTMIVEYDGEEVVEVATKLHQLVKLVALQQLGRAAPMVLGQQQQQQQQQQQH